jgi:hypothetical protein
MPVIIAELVLCLGVAIGGTAIWNMVRGMRARNWPFVEGTVIGTQTNSQGISRNFQYRYCVNGLEYLGARRSFFDYNSSDGQRAYRVLAKYLPGSVVRVYYHPDDPEDAVLEPGANIVSFLFLALGLLVIGIGVIGLLGFLG